jgi:hypothetical protein
MEARLKDLAFQLEMAGLAGAVDSVHKLGTDYARLEQELHQAMEEWAHFAQDIKA